MDCDVLLSVNTETDNLPKSEPCAKIDSTERFRVSKRVFEDCNNGVNYPSVPRKLRSAMKKRNLESVSRPLRASKKVNRSKTGVESLKKGGLKIGKQKQKLEFVYGSITKDEEEVVETLSSLASLFPDKLDNACWLEQKTLPLQPPEKTEILPDATGVIKEEVSLFSEASDPSLAKTKQIEDSNIRCPDSVSKQILGKSNGNKDIAIRVKAIDNSVADHENGLALWPGLCSMASSQSQDKHIPSKSSAVGIPAWMTAAVSPPPNLTSEKLYRLTNGKRSMKRCASHVYIARFIRDLRNSQRTSVLHHNHLNYQDEPEQRAPITALVSDLNRFTDCLTGSEIFKSSQKQGCNFLSLTPEDGKFCTADARNGSLRLSQPEFMYLHSFPHRHHQSSNVSSAYQNHLSPAAAATQAQNRLPLYLSNRISATNPQNPLLFSNQQHRFWEGVQFGQPTRKAIPFIQNPNLQTKKPDLLLTPSSYSHVNEQQLQNRFPAASSWSPKHVIKSVENQFVPVYDEIGGRFCINGAPVPPLQLL